MTRLAPGKYLVRLEDERGKTVGERVEVVVTGGGVVRAAFVAER
jgi:hypothetical protein